MEINTKKDGTNTLFRTLMLVLLALGVLMAAVGITFMRIRSKKAYLEKWQDYDECGLS